jgi:hypothetical protein
LVLLVGPTAWAEPPKGMTEERYPFEAEDMPWSKVFERLTEIAGKPVLGGFKLPGTFTFKGPPGRAYTAEEVFVIINNGLFVNKEGRFCLVRRERCFVLTVVEPNNGG